MITTEERYDEYCKLDRTLGELHRGLPGGDGPPIAKRRERLLAIPVTLPDGREVAIGQLTEEDHEAIHEYIKAHFAAMEAEMVQRELYSDDTDDVPVPPADWRTDVERAYWRVGYREAIAWLPVAEPEELFSMLWAIHWPRIEWIYHDLIWKVDQDKSYECHVGDVNFGQGDGYAEGFKAGLLTDPENVAALARSGRRT
jgi:hypothetical protein